jgi:hypothetical protein
MPASLFLPINNNSLEGCKKLANQQKILKIFLLVILQPASSLVEF